MEDAGCQDQQALQEAGQGSQLLIRIRRDGSNGQAEKDALSKVWVSVSCRWVGGWVGG